MKKGEFGTRQPVTGAEFCSKVEQLPTAYSISFDGTMLNNVLLFNYLHPPSFL